MRTTRTHYALFATIGLLFGFLGAPIDSVAQTEGGVYYPPPENQGGWRALVARNVEPTSEQKQQILSLTGLDWDQLDAAYDFMRSQHSGQDALLVIRHGYVVAEWGQTSRFHIASCTKSLTAIAMAKLFDLSDQGQLSQTIGPEDFAYHYLPASWGSNDSPRRLIQIKHLMSMSSGLEPNDSPTTSRGYLNTVLAQPAEVPPETDWAYSSAAVDLLSIIIQDLSGLSLRDFFNTHIGSEIGIPRPSWGRMGSYNTASAYASLTARDLARVAYLTLQDGWWDSGNGPNAVVTHPRIDLLTQWAPFLADTSFRIPNFFTNDNESHQRYGSLFWTNRTNRESFVGTGVPTDAYYMAGHFTQFVVAIPSLDMIVVRLGDGPAPWIDSLMSGVMTRIMGSVQGSNEPPVALDDSEATTEDESATVDVLVNDYDPDGALDPTSVAVVAPAADGDTEVNPDGTITYHPDLNHFGTDGFTYQVCDEGGACSTASVSLTLDPVDDPPLADDQNVTVTIDTPKALTLTGSEVDGDPLSFTVLSQPAHGVLSGTAPDLVYTPDPGHAGPDSFTFETSDGTTSSDVATVAITVSAVPPALFSDDFNRTDDTVVGNGWGETEISGTSVEIRSGRLEFVSTGDLAKRPIVQHSFPRAVSGVLTWSFQFDWSLTGPDNRYEVLMQLGDGQLLSNRSTSAGVGVHLMWSQISRVDETLGYRYGNSKSALTQISGPTSISVVVDLDQSFYDVHVDGIMVGTQIPLDRASELDTIRLITNRLDHSQHLGRAFDDMVIQNGSHPTP